MSAQPAKRKKMDTPASIPTNAGDSNVDHRKRRRNRTTQSCLHCHASKRMCDRKRPCGRCTQLGITGHCVYEIDDASQRDEDTGDKIHLQRRVAELECVIRELKNKPHPRSAQPPLNASQEQQGQTSNTPPTSPCSVKNSRAPQAEEEKGNLQSPSPKADDGGTTAAPHSIPKIPPSREGSLAPPSFEELPSPSSPFSIDPFNIDMASCSSSSVLGTPNIASAAMTSVPAFSSASPADETMTSLLSYFANGDIQFDAPLANLFDSTLHDISRDKDSRNACFFGHQTPLGECSCLSEATNYYAVLELSLRLRRAADLLGRYPLHSEGSTCLLKQRIADLDVFTSATLGGVNTPGMSAFRQAQPSFVGHHPRSACAPPEAGWSGGSVAFSMSAGVHPGNFLPPPCNSLMSWTPQQLWNTSTSPAPISWTNSGSHYPTTDTISSCASTKLCPQHLP